MNIFLDCGYYAGGAVQKYIDAGVVDDTWIIYGFEPNPEIKIKRRPNMKIYRRAVWIKNGRINFHIAGRDDAAGIADLTGHTDPKEISVSTIDFSEFVSKLPLGANIICSMDIEGAEYQVLEKMLADESIDRIKILDIEFHHRFMNDYTAIESEKLIRAIRKRGVKVKLKVALR